MQDYSSISDVLLWQLVQKGDKRAFSFVYNSYSTDLFKYGLKLGMEKALVEDVIHDLFVKLWSCKDGICINTSIKYYLFSSFRRQMVREVKSREKKENNFNESQLSEIWEQSFQEMLIENQITIESHAKLKCALDALSSRQKEAIYLKFVEDLSYDEIAEIMGIQVPSLYNLIFKSLKFLKNHLLQNNFYLKVLLSVLVFRFIF